MRYNGLYFIPTLTTSSTDSSSTLTTLITSLETHFHTLSRKTPWSLTYRLFRDTPPRILETSSDPASFQHSYQHFLTHSSLSQNRTYIYITSPNTNKGAGPITAIPVHQSEAQALLLRNQLAALWTPRHMLSVQNGVTFSSGLFTVQIGEVRALREGQGGGVNSPGVVVCISTIVGGEEDVALANAEVNGAVNGAEEMEFEFAQAAIRELWEKIREGRELGRNQVREVFMLSEGRRGEETNATVRMWCDVLKLRG